jgi:glycosyltransferase involved in cell wall biosynthesis
MVTADRPQFVMRAIRLFELQSYPHRELVIVDDGECDLSQLIEQSPHRDLVRYIRLPSCPRLTLGELRNLSIANARGSWCIQWDDDEWYHHTRIEKQIEIAVQTRVGASVLKWTLMHVNDSTNDVGKRLFRTDVGIGTPGTILFRRDLAPTYPHLSRNEDAAFMRGVRDVQGLAVMGPEFSHLFVRVFHGGNTWEMEHFLRRLRRRPIDWPSWLYASYIKRDLTAHNAFRLSSQELQTASDYFCFSEAMALEAAT